MTVRAVVIAVETFAGPSDLPQLPDVKAAAQRFIEWLRRSKSIAAQDVVFCASPGVPGSTDPGATKAEILAELARVVPLWRDQTEQLYFFFAGHGFCQRLREFEPYTDALVCADYRARATAGTACLRIDEIQSKLRFALGPGDHFYFLDGCRNPVSPNEVVVPDSGVVFGRSDLGDANTYTLHSTAPGDPAPNDSRFSELLLAGLAGRGRAKVALGAVFYVTFDRLRQYLRGKLKPRRIDTHVEGEGDGRICQITGVKPSVCTVEVRQAREQDRFELTFVGHPELQPVLFQGAQHRLEVRPDDYALELNLQAAAGGKEPVPRVAPPGDPVDVHETVSVVFQKPAPAVLNLVKPGQELFRDVNLPPSPAILAPARTRLSVLAPPGASVRVRGPRLDRMVLERFGEEVLPGRYRAELLERGGVVATSKVDLEVGEERVLDLVAQRSSPAHAAILQALPPHARVAQGVEFSETLGPMSNPDLSVWLAILGASRVLGHDDFSKLVGLGLADLAPVFDPARGAVYVLSAVPPGVIGTAALGDGPPVPLQPVPAIGAVLQAVLPDADRPGPRQLVLRREADEQLRIATAILPARVTVVTVVPQEPAGLAIRQLILPMHGVRSNVPSALLEPFGSMPLRFVRFSAEAQGRFLARRRVAPAQGDPENDNWSLLLYGKWLDPVMSLVAAYELLRRGKRSEAHGVLTAIGNLGRYFGELPDFEALRKLAHQPFETPAGAPLFLDGAIALGTQLPGYVLDYRSGWTVLHSTSSPAGAPPPRTPAPA